MAQARLSTAVHKVRTKAPGIIIASINPKFKAFSRPLLLAVCVGVALVGATIGIFVNEWTSATCVNTGLERTDTLNKLLDFVALNREGLASSVEVDMCLESIAHAGAQGMDIYCLPTPSFMDGKKIARGCYNYQYWKDCNVCELRSYDMTHPTLDGSYQCFDHSFEYTLGPALRIADVKNMGKDLALEELRISPRDQRSLGAPAYTTCTTPERPAPRAPLAPSAVDAVATTCAAGMSLGAPSSSARMRATLSRKESMAARVVPSPLCPHAKLKACYV